MSFLRQYRRYAAPNLSRYLPFVVDGHHVGWVKPALAASLDDKVFIVTADHLTMRPELATAEARSAAMATVLAGLRAEGRVPGWRNELYPVNQGFGETPLLVMERAAAPLFGVLAYGVNLNGFVGRGWEMKVWVARRSPTKSVDPNMLDLIVGGGQPLDLSPAENLLKECREEAGIPPEIAARAEPVGMITLFIEAGEGLRVGQQFNFDLELPEAFRPFNQDGEVAGFELIPVSELMHRLRSADEFMYDIALVLIDFLIRHGFIGPEEPDYLPLIAGLRRPIPFQRGAA